MARTITAEESDVARQLLARARRAMQQISDYDQARVDRICQAVGWAGANPETAVRLANMSVDESGMGSREPRRRAKVSASCATRSARRAWASSKNCPTRAS